MILYPNRICQCHHIIISTNKGPNHWSRASSPYRLEHSAARAFIRLKSIKLVLEAAQSSLLADPVVQRTQPPEVRSTLR